MKIIHTSDWHLGQEFYTYDRTEEHEAFLSQLRDIAATERPDALVVCGDIYHTATPSNSVMRFFTDWLDRIRQACPQMQIIVTAGNHDSSSRLEITRSLWAHLGVTVIGRIERKDEAPDIDRLIVPVTGEDGRKCGYVIALPHIFPQNYPALSEDTPREDRKKAFMAALGKRIPEINSEDLPVVMTAHLTISGGESFLTSLALALGLSSLSNRSASMDILFIDEGFGTLDSTYLGTVMDALEQLHQMGGRKIGIISHVESLKERLTTQVQVLRVNSTLSRIEVKSILGILT